MVTAKLYIEGGGEDKFLRISFREGWKEFFEKAGVGNKTDIVRGGGREQTYKLFSAAVSNFVPGTIPFLLVDSEGPVTPGLSTWRHLNDCDRWRRPKGAGDDQAFLMVQVMETWFLADRMALRKYFGNKLNDKALKAWPNLEEVSKQRIFKALKTATSLCSKRYSKGEISFELLSKIDPARVEAACPHAKALLERLRAV